MARQRSITPSIMLSRTLAASAMALGLIVSSIASDSPAIAQQAQPSFSSSRRSILDVVQDAIRYSRERNGVGIVIYYHSAPGLPPADSIGRRIVSEFQGRGYNSDYFVFFSTSPGASVSYAIEDVVIGPYGGKAAFANIGRAVELRIGASRALRPAR